MTATGELEFVDNDQNVVVRRVVVGPLDTNCWILADAKTSEAVVIDPGDDGPRLIDAARDLEVRAIVITHAHWDHVLALPTVADNWGCQVHAHREETLVWMHERSYLRDHGHFDAGTATAQLLACGCSLAPPPKADLWSGSTHYIGDGSTIAFGAQRLHVLHTPGHTPGGVSLRIGAHVYTGDTLFPGGPGLTGWPLSDFPTIIDSIRTRLFTLPAGTSVHPGHGPSTTVETEQPHLADWIERGW